MARTGDPNAAWWRGAVIYQVYPRSFQDTSGNGVGDLRGITERLDHVASLGVDAIWLSPFFQSPMRDMGYDVSDYRAVDPLFGTLDDFDALVERAHSLGLKIIIDQVLSHSSDKHPWFEESRRSRDNPKSDWYVWADPKPDGSPPNNWPGVFGGPAWEYEPQREQYYLHNFLIEQPDLNFHNPDVQDALLADMRFWLDRGVDGFRLDTVNLYHHDPQLRDNPPASGERWGVLPYDMQDHIYSKTRPENIAFLQRMRALTDEYEDRMLVGEVGAEFRSLEVMAEYTQGDDRLHTAYSFEFLRGTYGAEFFRSAIEDYFQRAPDAMPCWTFSNHDTSRPVSRWANHAHARERFAEQMLALLLALPGSTCIYQGEELGLPDGEVYRDELTDPIGIRFWPRNKGRDGCRTPMPWENGPQAGFTTGTPWLPVRAPHPAMSVAEQEADPSATLHRARRLLAFRRGSEALRHGGVRFLDVAPPLLAFERGEGEGVVLCAFNLEGGTLSFETEGQFDNEAPRAGASLENGVLRLEANGFAFVRL